MTGNGVLPRDRRAAGVTRANRLLLWLLGLVLLVAGLATILLGLGVFGQARADTPVFNSQLVDFADRNAVWFWPLIAAAALVTGVLAAIWLLSQGRSDQISTVDLSQERAHGRTRLDVGAFADAVSGEIASYRGVRDASARLVGSEVRPALRLSVTLDGRVAPGEVRRRIEAEAVRHAREALSTERLPTRIELTVPRRIRTGSLGDGQTGRNP